MKKKPDIRTTIATALKALGPSSPLQIADAITEDPAKVGYHLRAMKDAGQLTAKGSGKARVYALKGKADKAGDKTTKASADTPIAALTADRRLVLVHAGEPATVLPAEFTGPIGELLKAA